MPLSAEHILNVVARLTSAAPPPSVETHLPLKDAPVANTARYDRLRGHAEEIGMRDLMTDLKEPHNEQDVTADKECPNGAMVEQQPLSTTNAETRKVEPPSTKTPEPPQTSMKPDMIEDIINGRTYLQMAPITREEDD
ncbi:hypothetical protein PH586_22725 [Pseudomonas sp. SA3-5]|uniref:Uncharacterized protein n=1 Tax=Pseudomonas aestuarii TaxID=3018340 RepID=A0ABT4XLV0_9PSED|nr:hypothetical protein [Pseudomonas aestuarii]MDA7089198.1 hypothetical protein [Pseudomonas aestuarii]